jgi:hypothetical protein
MILVFLGWRTSQAEQLPIVMDADELKMLPFSLSSTKDLWTSLAV